jgi:hypothetical protein
MSPTFRYRPTHTPYFPEVVYWVPMALKEVFRQMGSRVMHGLTDGTLRGLKDGLHDFMRSLHTYGKIAGTLAPQVGNNRVALH